MIGRERQTVADVTLISTGSQEDVFTVSRRHNIRLDGEVAGVEFNETVTDKRVVNRYASESHNPATQFDVETEYITGAEGDIIMYNDENIEA